MAKLAQRGGGFSRFLNDIQEMGQAIAMKNAFRFANVYFGVAYTTGEMSRRVGRGGGTFNPPTHPPTGRKGRKNSVNGRIKDQKTERSNDRVCALSRVRGEFSGGKIMCVFFPV